MNTPSLASQPSLFCSFTLLKLCTFSLQLLLSNRRLTMAVLNLLILTLVLVLMDYSSLFCPFCGQVLWWPSHESLREEERLCESDRCWRHNG